jgi:hypothetical protein
MSRDIATVIANALGDEVIEPFFALDLEFDSGTLRFWSGVGTKTINGEDYLGAGGLLSISDIEETAAISAAGATITLSGIPSELLSLALTEPYQNRRCLIYFGLAGAEADMAVIFVGTMDRMDIEEGAETSVIQLAVENRLLDLERARVRRYSNNDQKSRFPNDRGLEFVESLQDRDLFWGRKPK